MKLIITSILSIAICISSYSLGISTTSIGKMYRMEKIELLKQSNSIIHSKLTSKKASYNLKKFNTHLTKTYHLKNISTMETEKQFQNNTFEIEVESNVKNRRLTYSALWTFSSLNYLYADLVGLMDHKVLAQYMTGTVNGMDITPGFLTVAAVFMQIPLANVFLPQVIKNDRTLRWVQIASGTIMSLVQASTLFVDTPTPYYATFSMFEIAATSYITIDAIKWKTVKNTIKRKIK